MTKENKQNAHEKHKIGKCLGDEHMFHCFWNAKLTMQSTVGCKILRPGLLFITNHAAEDNATLGAYVLKACLCNHGFKNRTEERTGKRNGSRLNRPVRSGF